MVPWEESRHMHKIRIWFTAQGPPTASLVFVLNPSPSFSQNLASPFSKSPKINFFKFFLFFFFFVR